MKEYDSGTTPWEEAPNLLKFFVQEATDNAGLDSKSCNED